MNNQILIEVSKESFFKKLNADKRDIMPRRPTGKYPNYKSDWMDQFGNLFGVSDGDKWFLIKEEKAVQS